MKEVLQGLFGDVVTEENLLEFGRLFVSRAAFERLQREAAADLALWQAGAKNLTAAKALLAWQDVDLQAADWQERLAEQVRELKKGADTAFLFAREFDVGEDCGWLGLAPAPTDGPLEDVAGFGLHLAQAEGNSLESIKIKQRAQRAAKESNVI